MNLNALFSDLLKTSYEESLNFFFETKEVFQPSETSNNMEGILSSESQHERKGGLSISISFPEEAYVSFPEGDSVRKAYKRSRSGNTDDLRTDCSEAKRPKLTERSIKDASSFHELDKSKSISESISEYVETLWRIKHSKIAGQTPEVFKRGSIQKSTIWSEEEDGILKDYAMKCIEKGYKPSWIVAVRRLKNKKNQHQCRIRWQRVLNPETRKGLWTKQEVDLLKEIVSKFEDGEVNWKEVSEGMNNVRSAMQCAQKWKNSLDPNLNKNKWSKDEDLLLEKIVSKLIKDNQSVSWVEVSKNFKGRHPDNCRSRCYQLKIIEIKK